jgi:hypothetical protein
MRKASTPGTSGVSSPVHARAAQPSTSPLVAGGLTAAADFAPLPTAGVNPGNFRCVHCAVPARALLRKTNGVDVLDTCSRCGRIIDSFVEHDEVHTVISLILLKGAAWRHVVFNSRTALVAAVTAAMCALLMEVLTAAVLVPLSDGRHPIMSLHSVGLLLNANTSLMTTAAATGARASALNAGSIVSPWAVVNVMVQPLPSLRVVNMVHNTRLLSPSALPVMCLLLFGAVMERALSLLTMMWLASILAPPGRHPTSAKHSIIAFSLASSARLATGIFLIWDAPLYFLALIDLTMALWYFKALGTVTASRPPYRVLATVFGFCVTRLVVRSMTAWSSPLPWVTAVV